MSTRKRRSRESGQGLMEFALVIPVFLVLVFGMIDLARVIWAMDNLGNSAREAARYASVHGGSDVTTCPTGPNLGTTPASGCPTWTPDSKEPTRIQARNFIVAGGSGTTVTVCYYTSTPCSGNTDQSGATNGRGAFVTVRITTTIGMVAGALVGLQNFTVTGDSTMIVNN
jgi:Flp pilus assembly protein TadG